MIDVIDNGEGNSVECHDGALLTNVKIVISGNGNRIAIGRCCLTNIVITVDGDANRYVFEDDCCVSNVMIKSSVVAVPPQTVDETRLNIGRGVQISEGQVVLGANRTSTSIGEGTNIVNARFFAAESDTSIEVREHCLFSWNVEVRTSDWHSIFDTETGDRINEPASVVIERNVWVGSDVRVLKGVRVGEGSVIGVGSIVTRDVIPRCVVGGNPAKVIRTNVNWSKDFTSL